MSEATMAPDTRIDQLGLVSEPMPSLSEVAQETGGAWPPGWYSGEIIQGYMAGGYQFETQSKVSRAGDSQNLTVCLKLTSSSTKEDKDGNSVAAGATRNLFSQRNYRVEDLTAANVARVKAGEADQRLKIVLGQLGQIEKAVGIGFRKHPLGQIEPSNLVGRKVEVRINIGDKGYNEVTGFRPPR